MQAAFYGLVSAILADMKPPAATINTLSLKIPFPLILSCQPRQPALSRAHLVIEETSHRNPEADLIGRIFSC